MQTTLCFFLTDTHILLAMKKRGFGAGKWNGYGGKIQPGEGAREAAVREVLEESGLTVQEADLTQVAYVDFYFARELRVSCQVFITKNWAGEANETEEMRPQWFPKAEIPYAEMWAADGEWIPHILAGDTITARVDFNAEGTAFLDCQITKKTFPSEL